MERMTNAQRVEFEDAAWAEAFLTGLKDITKKLDSMKWYAGMVLKDKGLSAELGCAQYLLLRSAECFKDEHL